MALVYECEMAEPSASDVVTRRLSIRVNGVPGGTATAPGNTVKFGGLRFNEGDDVELSLVDIDDAGNESPPALFSFVARDTIAPSAPGGFGAVLTHEVPDVATVGTATIAIEAHSKRDGKAGEGTKVGPAAGPESLDNIDGGTVSDRRKS